MVHDQAIFKKAKINTSCLRWRNEAGVDLQGLKWIQDSLTDTSHLHLPADILILELRRIVKQTAQGSIELVNIGRQNLHQTTMNSLLHHIATKVNHSFPARRTSFLSHILIAMPTPRKIPFEFPSSARS